MNLITGIRSHLLADPTIVSLVSARVYPRRRGSKTLPAIVLHLVSDVPYQTHDGPCGLRWARVQADCLGATDAAAVALAVAVNARMDGQSQAAFGTVNVQSVQMTDERDTETYAPQDEQAEVVGRSQDYAIQYDAA